ncbi:MAG: hypothetical protein JNK49_09825 [Planctomycetes bacterium]|nr:hypothetical protein [Planctomycetota bacterium]
MLLSAAALFGAAPTAHAQCNAQWNLTGGNPGFNGPLTDLLQTTGDLFACGSFTTAGTATVRNVARWNGTAWQAVGALGSSAADVRVLAVMNNGNLIAGGRIFTPVLSNPAHVSVFNGSSWAPLGSGPNGGSNVGVSALTVLPNGDVIAGGQFTNVGVDFIANVARWNGSSWVAMGNSLGAVVESLATLSDGTVVAGGSFVTQVALGQTANRLAVWGGGSWFRLGTGMNGTVMCLRALPDGGFLAGGGFTTANGISAMGIVRYSGGVWSPLGAGLAGLVRDIVTLPNGDVVASGSFQVVGNPSITNIARFDATTSTWVAIAPSGFLPPVNALALTPAGELAVGIDVTVGGATSQSFARLVSGCPALATPYGAGCTGPGGPLSLTAAPLPWIGATSVLRATGFGPNSLGLAVVGIAPVNIPLATIPGFENAGPTCVGLASPDVLLYFLIPNAGEVTWDFPIPNTPSLAGAVVFNQGVELEFGLSGYSFVGSTNGLQFTVGVF